MTEPAVAEPAEVPFVKHKVVVPPKRSLLSEIRGVVHETFFHNVRRGDSGWFHQAGVSPWRQAWKALKWGLPILDWLSSYSIRYFGHDLVAGLTTASLAIPQDLGYAPLAGLPSIIGLYSSFVPPLVYSVFGASRNISIGPVSVVSLIMGELMKQELSPTKDAAKYLSLAFTATMFAGIFQASLGILRLGFITEYLSHAAIVGFMAGAAITISLQQFRGLFNIKPASFSKKTNLVAVLKSVFHHTDQWNWRTIVMALAFIAFISSTKLLAKKKPKFFWVAVVAPMLSMIIATASVYATRIDKKGVQITGHIKKGLNPSSADQIFFSGPFLGPAVKIGLIAGLISMTEGLAIGRTFAKLRGHRLDGNNEMVAFGFMNICGSLLSCYVTTGVFSRSALSYATGSRTPMANILMAILVAITLSVLTPLIHYTPTCVLSAVVITAVLTIIDLPAAYVIWKVDTLDFITCLGAFFGTLFVSVEIGLLLAVCLSFVKVVFNATRPYTAILGNIPGTRLYQDVKHYLEATRVPGILAVRIDAAIYFSNSAYVHDKVLNYLEEEKQRQQKTNGPNVQYLILDLSSVTNIDTNGVLAIEEIEKVVQKQDIQLVLTNPRATILEKLESSNFLSRLGLEWIFMTVEEAIQVCSILRAQQDA